MIRARHPGITTSLQWVCDVGWSNVIVPRTVFYTGNKQHNNFPHVNSNV